MKQFLNVYIANIPENSSIDKIENRFRNDEIENINNIDVKKQKYWIWKLFEIAAFDSLGISVNNINFKRNKNGKIVCDSFSFSFSHSHNILLVAISSNCVGADIELVKDVDNKLIKKVLNIKEYEQYLLSKDKQLYFFKKWTQKEALYKYNDNSLSFIPSKIDTLKNSIYLKCGQINDYVYCVASNLEINEIKSIDLNK